MKKLKRLKSREYHKNRKSNKYFDLESKYQKSQKVSKHQFYNKIIKDLKQSNPGQWYSKLKRLCSYDEKQSEPLEIDEIKHLPQEEQAETLSEYFAKTRQEFKPLYKEDIEIPSFNEEDIPKFTKDQVESELKKLKTKKAIPPNEIPPKII